MHKFRWKKGLACGGLFLLLVGITLWLVLKDQNPAQLWTAVKQVRLPLLGVGLGCMAVYFCCEAKNIQTGLSLLDPLLHTGPACSMRSMAFSSAQ